MAIVKLTDFIKVANDKWTYGESKFGYDSDVNQDHNIIYPLMLIKPPVTNIDNVYDGSHDHDFEVDFYNTFQKVARDVVELQQRWDNLEDLALEWLDLILKNYNNTDIIINHDTVIVERDKDENNDKLVKINLTFKVRMFRRFFNPQHKYPTDVAGLINWLKADSNLTFDIPTGKISLLGDMENSLGGLSQSTESLKPVRYDYDGAGDKTRINFDSSQYLVSDNNLNIDGEFTMFAVYNSRANVTEKTMFGYEEFGRNNRIKLGTRNDNYFFDVMGAGGATSEISSVVSSTDYNIVTTKLTNSGVMSMKINDGSFTDTTIVSYDNSTVYKNDKFKIGAFKTIDFEDGNLQELIIYNGVLIESQIELVVNYLNGKFNIY